MNDGEAATPPEESGPLEELEIQHVALLIENERLRGQLNIYGSNYLFRVARGLHRISRRVLPAGSKRRRVASRVGRILLGKRSVVALAHARYSSWLADRQASPEALERQRLDSAGWRIRPLVSICMPVHDPDPDALAEALESVRRQSYENWELCICDDGSTDASVATLLLDAARDDERILLTTSEANIGIAAATNRALALATGEYVAFLDHDDLLEPDTLFEYVTVLQDGTEVDMFYCDEDLLGSDGVRRFPFLKPDWSPEVLLGMNYVTHFVVVKRTLVQRLGGMRSEFDGAQDYDLVLRLDDSALAVHHVPKVLYSWRQSKRSTSRTSRAKPWAYEAGLLAVRETLKRRGIDGLVDHGEFPGAYRVRRSLPVSQPHVEILIPTRDRVDLLRACIESIRSTTAYENYSITVVDNDSAEQATQQFLADASLKVVRAPGPFNYAAIMNSGFEAIDAPFILTLNNDTLVKDSAWLGRLVELALDESVGAVGCQLEFPDGRAQHEGIVVGILGPAANLVFEAAGVRLVGVMRVNRDVTAVTGACCLVRRSAWKAIGGFDEAFPVAYNDVDFCIRMREQGYRVLYTPFVSLVHAESASRGDLHPAKDEALLIRRWCRLIADGDPFFPRVLRSGPYGYTLASEDSEFRGRELALLNVRRSGRG